MDAITLLKKDHKTVEQLFKRFEQAGDRAYVEKRQIVDRIIEELSVHAAIEEQLFYPAARAEVPETEGDALESMEEHHIVKWQLAELEKLDPRDERFDAKVTVLIENVRHHVDEEENEFFPKVREELGRNDLGDLGDAMDQARATAPTHPHPRSPQRPPANFVVGAAAATFDRVTDTVSGVAQGAVNAAKDLVSRVPGVSIGASSPTGSSTSRRSAARVRDSVDDVADAVEDTATTAARGAARTVDAATAGAKGTVTSAKRGAKGTRTTAKRAATTTGRTAKRSAKATRSAAS